MNFYKPTVDVHSILPMFRSYEIKSFLLKVCAKFTLPTLANRDIKTDFSDLGRSYWVLPSKVLAEVVGTFRSSQEEVTTSVSNKGFQMKTYVLTFEDKEQERIYTSFFLCIAITVI